MKRTTNIEWTEHTWNPFVGCSVHTDGCKNCYAMRTAYRMQSFGTIPHYDGVVKVANGRPVWAGQVNRASDRAMNKPRTISGSALIFVNSMSDFFHANARDEWRSEALKVMQDCPQHTFQILTKRADLIAGFFERTHCALPSNVWLGVTVENSKHVERVNLLKASPAKTRFISFEPLIGCVGDVDLTGIDWAISGGESGANRRHCAAEWVRNIRNLCSRDGVAFFHKQWGHWSDNPIADDCPSSMTKSQWVEAQDPSGKGGSLLDGIYHKEFPIVNNLQVIAA